MTLIVKDNSKTFARKVTVNNKPYDLHLFTGDVVGDKSWVETDVSGNFARGSGSVSTTTTLHDTVYLRSESGQEEPFQFKNLKLPFREGHTLSVISGARAKKRNQEPVAWFVYNHSTEQGATTDDFNRMVLPPTALIVVLLFLGIFIAPVFNFGWYMYIVSPAVLLMVSGALYTALKVDFSEVRFTDPEFIRTLTDTKA